MEYDQRPEIDVKRLNEGLGFGAGAITGTPQGVTPDMLAGMDHAIETHPAILVPVDTDENGRQVDDDGCGDGRGVKYVFKGAQILKRSLNRAKVFGGSVAMAAGTRIGMGKAAGKDLNTTFEDAMGDLAEAEIDFGGHTDERAEGENCGCGAIDKAPEVVANTVRFRQEITGTALALGASPEGIDEVLDNYASYAAENTGRPYSGSAVMKGISFLGKIVKRLAGSHQEARIILNTVENYTVNQGLIRELSGGKIQVFAVDVWRMQQIAQRLHPEDEALQQRSFVSQLVYTLGVAATLTDGTLPAYLIQKANVPVGVKA